MKLDIKDRRILLELDRNARISSSQIAKKVGLTKAAVIHRIKKLEENEIIQDYITVIDTMKLGYVTYDSYLQFQNTTPKKEQEIIEYLVQHPKVWFVVSTFGYFDIAVLISAKSVTEYTKIWNEIYEHLLPHVSVSRTSLLIEYLHYSREYLVPGLKQDPIQMGWGTVGNERLDRIDSLILKILSMHSRKPIVDIAEKVGLTAGAVRHRMTNLEKRGIISGYSVNLNLRKLGYQKFKVQVTLSNLEHRYNFAQWLKQHKNVTYYDTFIGGVDLEFAVEIESLDLFLEFIRTLKQKFGTSIRKVVHTQPQRKHKATYFPH